MRPRIFSEDRAGLVMLGALYHRNSHATLLHSRGLVEFTRRASAWPVHHAASRQTRCVICAVLLSSLRGANPRMLAVHAWISLPAHAARRGVVRPFPARPAGAPRHRPRGLYAAARRER